MNQIFDWIVRSSIRHRQLVVLGAAVVMMLIGWFSRSTRFDALPSFTPPMVVVQAEAPGMGSAEVEERITTPLEQALLGTPEARRIRSTSAQGLGIIELTFADETDIFRARQLVSERVASMRDRLPSGVPAPALAPISAPVGALLKFCLTPSGDDARSMRDLSSFAAFRLRPRLSAIQGVSRVTIHGGAAVRIEVRPDPAAMIARGVTLSDLELSLRQAQGLLPMGFAERGSERQPIRIDGYWTLDSSDAIAATVIAPATASTNAPVRVGDVAEVAIGEAPAIGAAVHDGRSAIYVQIDKLPWADTVAVTREVEAALAELDASLPKGAQRQAPTFRQADFVKTSLNAVGRAAIIGAVLVAVVLIAFLRSGRLVAISLTALPLSILAAVAVLLARGVTLNGMILGGLTIAVGEVVDDAIVDVENIWRRLRETSARESASLLDIVQKASLEVRGAIVYASVIIVAVLAPIVLLGGIAGRIFSPLAEAYAIAMAASLFVALTVTPAMCALLLPRIANEGRNKEPFIARRLRAGYEWLLEHLVRPRARIVVLVSAALGLGALVVLPFLGGGFLPDFREGVLIAEVNAWPGTSLEETTRISKRIDAQLRSTSPHIAARIGRASNDEDAAPVHRIEMDLVLPPNAGDPEDVAADIARRMARVPGVRFTIEGFLGERVNELLSGDRAPLAVKLYGDGLADLRARARDLVPKLAAIDGVQSVRADALVDVPTTDLKVDDAGLGVLGVKRSDVATASVAFRQGLEVAQARAPGGFSVPVVIAGEPLLRQPDRIADVPIFASARRGSPLPISAGVHVVSGSEPSAIRHEQGRRVVTLAARVATADLAAVSSRVENLLRSSQPAGSSWEIAGQAAERKESRKELAVTVAAVLVAMFVFLWAAFRSSLDAGVVLAGIPLGLVGGVLAALALPEGLSMAGLVGFVTLLANIVRSNVLLVAHKNDLIALHPETPRTELVLQAARERLVPILMTASAAFLGLLPLAISIGSAGSELEAPMAVIVCGGLVTSTILTLVAMPAFYVWRASR